MSETDPGPGERHAENLPSSVAAHELVFGRESTSGYLLERWAHRVDIVDACAGQVIAAPSPTASLEQNKPASSLRV